MKIPQLFVRIGNNKFCPVPHTITNKPLYFWDDSAQEIKPADKLKLKVIDGCPYFVLERTQSVSDSRGV